MIVYYCDKCKREFKEAELSEISIRFNSKRMVDENLSLCKECTGRLLAFARMSDQEYVESLGGAIET